MSSSIQIEQTSTNRRYQGKTVFPDWHLNLRFSLVKSRSMTPLKSALYFLLVLRPGGSCQKWPRRAAICPDADQSGSRKAPWSTSECILRTCEEATLCTAAVKEERKSESTREGCLLKTRKWDFRMPTAHHQETGQTSRSICLSFCHGNSLNTLQTRQQNAGTTDTSLDDMPRKLMSFFFHVNGCHTNSFSSTCFLLWHESRQVCFCLYDVCFSGNVRLCESFTVALRLSSIKIFSFAPKSRFAATCDDDPSPQ